MKLFVKKQADDSLRSLNEEEIQKKLYGTFHRPTPVKNSAPAFSGSKAVPFTKPRLIEKRDSSFALGLKTLNARLSQSLKTFPWKFSALVVGLILLSIYSFQFLSVAIHNLTKPKMVSQTQAQPERPPVQIAEVSKPLTPVVPQEDIKPVATPKKSYYAVQICTYQKESDAKGLAGHLNKLNFPAFYQRMQGSKNKSAYYVVFIGKDASYSTANQKLKEFRKSEEYQKFPDAFIRSI